MYRTLFLMGVAVGLFFLVNAISNETQGVYIADDPTVQAEIDARIRPVGRVLLLGDAELAAAAAAAVAAPRPVATVMTGPQVYNAACIVCHQPPGTGGAPPIGDVALWAPRIAQGMDTLYMHALQGFHGVTLLEAETQPTVQLLTEVMGFDQQAVEGDRIRFRAASDSPGIWLDLLPVPGQARGRMPQIFLKR